MTLAPPDRPTVFDARTIDMRCAAVASMDDTGPGPQSPAHRCQLLAGHGGEHALMYAGTSGRRVVMWAGRHADVHPPAQDWRALAWMRGLPAPAWFQNDPVDV